MVIFRVVFAFFFLKKWIQKASRGAQLRKSKQFTRPSKVPIYSPFPGPPIAYRRDENVGARVPSQWHAIDEKEKYNSGI